MLLRGHVPRSSITYPAVQFRPATSVLVEEDHCCLAVTPREIAEKLVNCLAQLLWPLPYLALGNEGGSVLNFDSYVGLAPTPERLPGGVALVVAIQVSQHDIAEVFFPMNRVGCRG